MAKSDRNRAGDDNSPALSVAPSEAMFLGVAAAGVLAKKGITSPAKRIDKAIDMGRTATRGEIHRETGVNFGRDGKPRFEISDHRARLTGAVPQSGAVSLKEVLSHPALFGAVPSANDLTVSRGPADMQARGTLLGNHITLHPDLIDTKGNVSPKALPILLHEIQHHVQDIEGFHPGGSPDDFRRDHPRDEKARIAGYEKMAGEVEARLTQSRAGLNVEQRQQFYPKGDVALQDQNLGPKNPTGGERSFIDLQGVKDAASNAFQQLFNKDMADNKPARFRKLDPRQINSDPNTFQFKSGGDSHGVTDRLKGVKSWDNVAAGKAVVFERANGELIIADGHQRLGLAKRLAGEGQKINMDAYVLRERDGWSARDVYAYAALKNIKESSGQALDMAKVMRERPDLVNGSVPMSDAKVRDAANLAKLSKPAFDMVVGGVIKPEYAAQVGARIGETTRHADMLTEMAKANIASAQHAGLYIDQALSAGSISESQNSLFGEETKTRSLIAERAAVLDKALGSLKSDKRIFALLEREAGTIEGAGNKLSHETNAARASEAGNTAALVERLAKNRGPVSDMLEAAARQMAEGKKPQVAARSFVKSVGDALKAGGMRALTGDAPEMHQMVNQNQTSMFSIEPKAAGAHHVWDDKARAASAEARKTTAKPIETSQQSTQPKGDNIMSYVTKVAKPRKPTNDRVRMSIDDGQGDMMPKATTKDRIAAESRKKAAKGRTGDSADHGLFSSSRHQSDIVEHVRRVDDEVKRIQGRRKAFAAIVRETNAAPVAAPAPKKRRAAAKAETPGTIDKVTSGKRGTQNVANLEAINANRKAKGKTAKSKPSNLPDPIKVIEARNATARAHAEIAKSLKVSSPGASKRHVAIGRDLVKRNEADIARLEARAAQLNAKAPINTLDLVTGGAGDDRPMWKRQGITRLPKGLAFNGDRVVVTSSAPTPSRRKKAAPAGANGTSEADRIRRFTNRMKAAGTAKSNAQLRAEALTTPLSGVADRMRAKMNSKPDLAPLIDKLASLSGKMGEMSKNLDTAADAFRTVEAKPAKRSGGKIVGALAPIAIGAAMIVASSKAKAEGRDTGDQIKEAAKEGVKGGTVMAGFAVGTAAVTGGLMRAGMTAAKAIPATSVALMGYGAVSEGVAAFRHGEGVTGIAKAAVKGAWDMSLPGMVVNTGVAVHDAFNAANTAYRAPAKDSSESPASGTSGARRGWANPTVQAAAQAAKGRTFSGFTRADLR